MKYINLTTFNSQYLGRPEYKGKVFFNSNNTVAIFEENDTDILKYVTEKAEELKNADFSLNPETEQLIREYVENLPPVEASTIKEFSVDRLADEKFIEAYLKANYPLPVQVEATLESTESTPLFNETEYAALMEQFEFKVTVAQLGDIVKSLIVALQKR